MKTVIKTTLAMAAAAMMMSGCEALTDTSSEEFVYDSGTSSSGALDTITIRPITDGFVIDWRKRYSGYSEVIYTDGNAGARGNGYPFTNNATGDYTMTCTKSYEDSLKVGYICERPDITIRSGVTLEKGVEYQWLVSYGFDHDHGEPQAIMQYVGDTLIIQ